jgi:hypothetical protein
MKIASMYWAACLRTGTHRERADLGDRVHLRPGRHPAMSMVRSQVFPSDSTTVPARPFRRFRLCARRVGVQVPENRRLRQLGQRRMGRDPATRLAGPLADRPADLRRHIPHSRKAPSSANAA